MKKTTLISIIILFLSISVTVIAQNPGDMLWSNSFGGAISDMGWCVQQTSDEGYVISGWTDSFGAGDYDIYLIKTDAAGDTLWTKIYGEDGSDDARCIRQTPDGGYIIAGNTQPIGIMGSYIWLLKTDSLGDTLWTKKWGETPMPHINTGRCVQLTSDGGYIISGHLQFSGSGFVITQIGDDFDEANAMDMQLDGKIVLAGFKADFSAANDIALARYFASDLVLNPPTNLIVVADTGLFTWNAPVSRDLTGYDVYLDSIFLENVTDTEFQFENLVYEQTYLAGVSAVYDEGTSEIIEIDFIYTGTAAGNDIVSNTGLIGNYPNPFNPSTTISFSLNSKNTEDTELIIYNLKGQRVKVFTFPNGSLGTSEHSVIWNGTDENNNPVSSGIYLYKLKSGKYTSTKKMILMK